MMPLPPHTVLEQHAREVTGRYGPAARKPRAHDPDGFLTDDALRPDPLYMALRHVATTGLIAAVRRWVQGRGTRREVAVPTPLTAMPESDTDQSIAA